MLGVPFVVTATPTPPTSHTANTTPSEIHFIFVVAVILKLGPPKRKKKAIIKTPEIGTATSAHINKQRKNIRSKMLWARTKNNFINICLSYGTDLARISGYNNVLGA